MFVKPSCENVWVHFFFLNNERLWPTIIAVSHRDDWDTSLSAFFAPLVHSCSSEWCRRCMEQSEKQEEGESMKPTGVMISRETHSRGTRWSLHGRIWCRRKHRHKCLFGFWWDCESCYTSSLLSHLFVCSLLYFINNSRLKRFKVHSQTNSFASWILSQSFIFCSSPRLLGGFNVLCPRKKS